MTQESEKIFTKRYVNVMFADLLQRICNGMLAALLPLYMVDMGYPKSVAGLTTTVYMLVAVVFRPVVGKLVDTRGRWGPLFIGTVVFLVGSAFFSARIPLPLFLFMRGLQGLSFAFIGTAVMTMATDLIPRHRMSEGIGYLGLTQTIARAFFPMVALSLKDAFGYTTTYMVIFAIGVLDVLAALALRQRVGQDQSIVAPPASMSAGPEERAPRDRGWEREGLWGRIVDKDAWKPSSIMMVFMFAGSSIMTFIIVYAAAEGIANAGVFFTVSAITVAVGRLAVGRMSQRFGSVSVVVPGLILGGAGMLVLYWLNGIGVLIAAGALSGLAAGMLSPELNSLAVLLARDERRGLANSTFFMAMDLGGAAGAIALGAMADRTGLPSIFLTGACLTAATLFAYLLMNQRGLFRVPERAKTVESPSPARPI